MSQPAEEQPDQALRRLAKEIRVWREEALRGSGGLDDLTLAAYVSGELDEAARREVEENLAACPELEEVVGVVRQTLERGDWQAKPLKRFSSKKFAKSAAPALFMILFSILNPAFSSFFSLGLFLFNKRLV